MPHKTKSPRKGEMSKWGDFLMLVRLHNLMLQDHLIENADLKTCMKGIIQEVEKVNKKEGLMTGGMKFWQSLMYALGFTAVVTDPNVVVGIRVTNSTTGAGIGVDGNGQTYQFQANTTGTEIAVTKGFDVAAARKELTDDTLGMTVVNNVFNLTDATDQQKLELTLYFTRPVDYSEVKSSVVGMPLLVSPDGYALAEKTIPDSKWLNATKHLMRKANEELDSVCQLILEEGARKPPEKPKDSDLDKEGWTGTFWSLRGQVWNQEKYERAKSAALTEHKSAVTKHDKDKYGMSIERYVRSMLCPGLSLGEVTSNHREITNYDGMTQVVTGKDGKAMQFFAIKYPARHFPLATIQSLLLGLMEDENLVDRAMPHEFLAILAGPYQRAHDILHTPMSLIERSFAHKMQESLVKELTDLRKAIHELESGEGLAKKRTQMRGRKLALHNATVADMEADAKQIADLTDIAERIEFDKVSKLREYEKRARDASFAYTMGLIKDGASLPGRVTSAIAMGGIGGFFQDTGLMGAIGFFLLQIGLLVGTGAAVTIYGPIGTLKKTVGATIAVVKSPYTFCVFAGKCLGFFSKKKDGTVTMEAIIRDPAEIRAALGNIPAGTPVNVLTGGGGNGVRVDPVGVVAANTDHLSPPPLANGPHTPAAAAALAAAINAPPALRRQGSEQVLILPPPARPGSGSAPGSVVVTILPSQQPSGAAAAVVPPPAQAPVVLTISANQQPGGDAVVPPPAQAQPIPGLAENPPPPLTRRSSSAARGRSGSPPQLTRKKSSSAAARGRSGSPSRKKSSPSGGRKRTIRKNKR
jgi:hypothetical protein